MNDYQRIEKAIQYLSTHYTQQPDLNELARVAGVSRFHFQRMFSRWAGISPKQFLKFLTARQAGELLRRRGSVMLPIKQGKFKLEVALC